MNLRALANHQHQLAAYGLGAMFLLAGVSKFIVLNQWIGYTPAWALQTTQLSPATIMHISSVVEILLAIGIIIGWKRHIWAGIGAVWLASITVMTAMAGIYDVAIRDAGLVAYSAIVALAAYKK